MVPIPTTAVSSYNDVSQDSAGNTFVPLLTKNAHVDGSLNQRNFDTVDDYVIDVVGGSRDSSGSLRTNESFTISYQLDGPGTFFLHIWYSDYATLQSGKTLLLLKNGDGLSDKGTITVDPPSSFGRSYPADAAVLVEVGSSVGINTFNGTYHLNFNFTGGTPPGPTPEPTPGPSDNGDGNLVSAGNGHSYQYKSFNGAAHTWDEANAMATAMGGYLVTIHSQAENSFITSNVIPGHLTAGLSGAFIGSTDAGHEGLWVWATGPEAGTAFSNGPGSINGQYTNWAAGEPNGGTAENYGLIGADGQWLDVAASRNAAFTTGFIIEYSSNTAEMILRNKTNGTFEIYNLGRNAILAAAQLGQVGLDWQFSGIGNFSSVGESDMLLRNSNTGGFEVYDISDNKITNAAFMGAVGLDWQVMGFGNFGSFGETDMILRNVISGGVEVYDIHNNQVTGANFMGTVGLDWQVAGFGNFSSRGTSDMILRNKNTGGLEVYDINSNQITGAAFMGAVGLDWKTSGFGNFSGKPGETDMLLRNVNTGGLEVYDIANNQVTNAAFLGTIGLDWQFAGVAPIHAAGASDLVLRNVNTGAFEVYNIANNQITGAALLGTVGVDWQLGGFAADPATGSIGSSGAQLGSTAQLVQAMAGFGGGSGADESLNAAPLGADTSQQQLLTTPQHA
jgi:Lectin C-type domain